MSRSKITKSSLEENYARISSGSEPSSPQDGDFWLDNNGFMKHRHNGAWTYVSNKFAAFGGTETELNGYKYHTFTTSGSLEIVGSKSVDDLVVAGGASGASDRAGGGGAGGMISGTMTLSDETFTITVGAGGALPTDGRFNTTPGGNTTALGLTALGGGRAGTGDGQTGGAGGSGGGGGNSPSVNPCSGGSGTTGQGNSGGYGVYTSPNYGGGGGSSYSGGTAGTGGTGGGGNGTNGATQAGNGSVNTGGGGGSAGQGSNYGGLGGSGIVIIRYAI